MTACWAVEDTAAMAAASLVATVTSNPADCSTRFLLCKLSVPPTQSTAAISTPAERSGFADEVDESCSIVRWRSPIARLLLGRERRNPVSDCYATEHPWGRSGH
jgi:hypothetical protein